MHNSFTKEWKFEEDNWGAVCWVSWSMGCRYRRVIRGESKYWKWCVRKSQITAQDIWWWDKVSDPNKNEIHQRCSQHGVRFKEAHKAKKVLLKLFNVKLTRYGEA